MKKFLLLLALLIPSISLATTSTITFTQGDTPTLTLTAATGSGTNFDLTGATFTTYVIGNNGTISSFPNAEHTADADQSTNTGKYTLALTATDTASIAPGHDKEILTKVVQGSLVTYFRARLLTVLPAIPQY